LISLLRLVFDVENSRTVYFTSFHKNLAGSKANEIKIAIRNKTFCFVMGALLLFELKVLGRA